MQDFIYTTNSKTISKLKDLGYPLLSVDGGMHTFVNYQDVNKFSMNDSDYAKLELVKVNKMFI